jgi:hypothetical protein
VDAAAFVYTSRWLDNEKLVYRAAKTLNSTLLTARKRQSYTRMLVQHQKDAAASVRMTKTAGAVEAEAEVTDTEEKDDDQAIMLEVEVELRRRDEASRKEEAEKNQEAEARRKQEAEVKANVQAEERRQREKTEAHTIAKAIAEAEAERVVQRLARESEERAMHSQSKQTSKSTSCEAGIKTKVESAVHESPPTQKFVASTIAEGASLCGSAGLKSETFRNDVRLDRYVPIDHDIGEATGLGQAASETAENLKRRAPQRAPSSSTPSTKRRVNIHVPVSMKSSEEDLDRQPQLSADAALALLNQLCHVDQSQPATDHSDSQMYLAALRIPQSEASSTSVSDPNCMLEQSSQFGGVYKREQRRQTAVAVCGMRNRYHDSEDKEADCRMRNLNHDAAGSEFDVFRRTASDGAVLQRHARGSARIAAGPESPGRHAQQHGQHFARLVLEHLFTLPFPCSLPVSHAPMFVQETHKVWSCAFGQSLVLSS